MIQAKKSVRKMEGYSPPLEGREEGLRLDFNENTIGCSPKVVQALKKVDVSKFSMYPEYSKFKKKLARFLRVKDDNLLLTNGTDEAIKVVLDTFVEKGDEVVIPVPTFAMFKIYATIAGASVKEVAYDDNLSFPVEKVLGSIGARTKVVVIVNPNNPTGTAVDKNDIVRIVEKARKNDAIVLIDEAYYEFYGKSSIGLRDKYGNVIVSRTFSKAFGLAGLRLGCIVGQDIIVKQLEKVISPYSVNSLAVYCGDVAIDDLSYVNKYVTDVKQNKKYLEKGLKSMGLKVFRTNANFLLVDLGCRCRYVCKQLAKEGILIRDRSSDALLEGCARITVGTKRQCGLLLSRLGPILSKGILFDMDGVLADVSSSYRKVIKLTAEFFTGSDISYRQIQAVKEEGGFNNDWVLTDELIRRDGKEVSFRKVKQKFQEYYLGDGFSGLITKEKLAISRQILANLSERYILGIVTGRPKVEASYFLDANKIRKYFPVIICMEDLGKKGKPDPYGINLAMEKVGLRDAFFFGDAIDDMTAAIGAGVTPVGVITPGLEQKGESSLRSKLSEYGAKVVIDDIDDIEKVL